MPTNDPLGTDDASVTMADGTRVTTNEKLFPPNSFFRQSDIDRLHARFAKDFAQPLGAGDTKLVLSVARLTAITKFQAAMGNLIATKILRLLDEKSAREKMLLARIENLEAAFSNELAQLRPLLNERHE